MIVNKTFLKQYWIFLLKKKKNRYLQQNMLRLLLQTMCGNSFISFGLPNIIFSFHLSNLIQYMSQSDGGNREYELK